MKYKLEFFETPSADLTTLHGIIAACGNFDRQAVYINLDSTTNTGIILKEKLEPKFTTVSSARHKIQNLRIVASLEKLFESNSLKTATIYGKESPWTNYFLLGFLTHNMKKRPIVTYVYECLRNKYEDITIKENELKSNFMSKIILDLWQETYGSLENM